MVFTTLAIGQPYISLAREQLTHLSKAGNEVVVSTSFPDSFPDTISSIKCPEDGTHVWHRKRHAIRAGLERSSRVVFLDSDYQLRPWNEAPLIVDDIPPGFLASEVVAPIGSLWFDRQYLDLITKRFGIDWKDVLWWGCPLFALSDDGKGLGKRFLDFWDEFACWVRDEVKPESDSLFMKSVSDCVAMAFAAKACGIVPVKSFEFFRPIITSFHHLHVGKWESS